MIKTILFDLDGTLIDPKVGITTSIRYAMRKLERPLSPQTNLDWCIGPPIQQNFATLLQTDDPVLIEQGIAAYREYFAETGLLENDLYDGVPDMLAALNELGLRCYVATSKPAVYARPIVEHFGLTGYFRQVYGSELDGTNGNKGDLIRHVLAEENLQPAHTLMVGDRKHDMLGAQENGVLALGVLYGYGSRDELETAGSDYVVDAPGEIGTLCRQLASMRG
ncbi:MAG: HAD hydrolase-like protein [Anaerolineae bacterium]|nr:HAD hydrolase-like protein [Anaerolineae bacterium]